MYWGFAHVMVGILLTSSSREVYFSYSWRLLPVITAAKKRSSDLFYLQLAYGQIFNKMTSALLSSSFMFFYCRLFYLYDVIVVQHIVFIKMRNIFHISALKNGYR
jgi:hypothetical protein